MEPKEYTVVYYAILFIANRYDIHSLQLISVPIILIVNYLFWRLCNTKLKTFILRYKITAFLVTFVGGLSLEIYLVQPYILTKSLNFMFTLNIPILLISVIFVAFLIKCVTRFVIQTLNDGDYDWKLIIPKQ